LAKQLQLPVRHCSEALRDRATHFEYDFSKVPQRVHDEVDEETRAIVATTEGLVVEGRFLDKVLAAANNICSVKLTCNDAERAARLAARFGSTRRIESEDQADRDTRLLLYGDGGADDSPAMTIATDAVAPEEVAARILAWISEGLS